MKKLLEKIRRILRNRRTRRLLARVVSVTAALVVFVTSYALVLPAITMETNALCGMEAHEHTDDCYTEELICGLEESPGHTHDESCYEVSQIQVCRAEEHQHDQSCYDDEGNLTCQLEEHEHTDECFEEHKELICDIPESDGHTHTAECYQKTLTCGKEVHIHSTECYEQEETDEPEDIYEMQEYSDDMTTDETDGMEEDFEEDFEEDSEDDFAGDDQDSEYDPEDGEDLGEDFEEDSGEDFEEDFEEDDGAEYDADTSDKDESDEDGSDEDDSALSSMDEAETVLTMDDEISVEDGDSPDNDGEDISDKAGQEDGEESGQQAGQEDKEESGQEIGQEDVKDADTASKDAEDSSASTDAKDDGNDSKDAEGSSASTDEKDDGNDSKDAEGSSASTDVKDAGDASADADAAGKDEDAYVPELDPLNFEAVLNRSTGIYYYHVSEDETIENSSAITDWNRVEEDTELGKSDLLRVYLSYTIPPGSLNGTNPTARYRLPENIRLSDEQVEAINKSENGIAAAYSDSEEDYQKYLGMEAVEGARKPDEKLKDDAQEFISATVRAENIYDEEDKDGEAGTYQGQELIFTFAPYSIEKNRNTYDADHKIVSAGEEITGWFVCDLNTDQVEWSDETVIRETELPEDFSEERSKERSEERSKERSEELSEGDREDDPGTIEDVSEDSGKNRDQAVPEGVSENSGDNRDQKAPKDTPEESRDTQDQDISEDSPDKQDQDASEENRKNDQDHQGTPEENQKNSRDEQDAPEDIQDNSETIQENVEKGLNEDGNYTGPEPDSSQTEPEPDSNQTGAEPDGNHTATIIVTVEKTAEIIFAAENKEEGNKEISSRLRLVEQKAVERVIGEDGAAGSEDTAVTASEDEKSKDASDVEKEASDSEKDHADAEKDGAEGASDKEKAPSEKEENTENKKEEDKQTFKPGTLISEGDGYRITLDYTEEAQIPDSAELSVREITAETDKEAYEQCLAQAKAHVGKEGKENTDVDTGMSRFFDIEILVKNQEADDNAAGGNGTTRKIEPAAPVKVSIQIFDKPAAATEQASKSDPAVLHFAQEGVEQIDATTTTEGAEAETGVRSDDSGREAAGTGKKSAEKAGMASGSDAAGTGKESGKGSKEKNGTASGTSGADKESSAVPDTSSEGGKTTEVRFEAESFSIYGLVYTVDFLWEVNGRSFKFNIPGGGFVSFSKLFEAMGIASGKEINTDVIDLNDILASDNTEEISEETRSFVAGIEKMEFSRPDLLWVGLAEEDTTVSSLRARLSLDAEYSASIKPEEIDKINETEIEKGDWVLLSVKAFETQETLTVTMKDGELFTILVTDEQNAIMNPDGQTVQTIPNPSGTTINMFDYWIDNETEVARRGWLGYRRSGTTGYDSSFWNYFDDQNTNTNGNNVGINYNHRLKFLPSMGGQVQDWETDGTYHATSSDGRIAGINSWNGKNENNTNKYNGEPTTGIVANALYNSSGALDPDGYPRLNSSLGGESLNYLFNPETGHSGKRSYTRANNLFYVDPDGYYTYDSMDYSASMNKSTKQFTLREQPTNDNRAGIRGFWPMGDLNYWLGMHLKAEFSMPQNGEVLNPKGVYKPMEFQFSGDDDAWAYVDGILVADGGGIHNRTELDIDFKTGIVKVIGGTYTDLSNPDMTVVSERTLYQIFSQAHSNGLISNDKWNSYEWADYDGDGTPDTFAQGTNLTFDFFYLERGGGESNLYIHYNLISTTDFSAHKSYHMLQNDPNARLQRDQFKFELIGFDEPGNEGETIYAVMPDKGAPGGDGSFESPQKVHNNSAPGGAGVPDGMTAHTSLIIGVTEDGNVNFGDVEISSAYEGKEYKYMVREVVPDDAVNADGVRWDAADESLKAEGGFIKDGITYDGKIYYFKGKVYETEDGSGKYELKKTRYTDSTYTEIDDQTKFFSFVNGYVRPLTFKVLKRNETGETPLDGAQFTLTRAMQDQDGKWVVRTYQNGGETIEAASRNGTTSNGEVSFNNLTEGHFILEETAAPSGYEKGDPCRWLLTLTKQDSDTEILLIPTIQGLSSDGTLIGESRTLDTDTNNVAEYQILNQPKMIRLTLTKEWMGGAPDNSEVTFELKRYRSYDKPGAPLKSTLNVYRVPDSFDLSRGVLEWSKEFAANTTARVRWTYDYWMGSVWKDGLYRIDNGANQNAGSSGGTFSVYVPMPSQGAVNLYIRDGNMYGDYSQHQVRVSEPTGTAPSS